MIWEVRRVRTASTTQELWAQEKVFERGVSVKRPDLLQAKPQGGSVRCASDTAEK